MAIFVTRAAELCFAHRCRQPQLSEAENRACYGKESRLHGHNVRVEVTVTGAIDPQTAMVIHLTDLASVIKRQVVDVLDHRRLDTDVPFFQDRPATMENISLFVWEQLVTALDSCKLYRIRIHQDSDSHYDYCGQR